MVPSLVSDTALPNKVLQYMASGLPVVSTRLKGLACLFESTPGLVLVPNPTEVLAAAISLASEPNRREIGEENRKMLVRKFSTESVVDAFEQRLERIGKLT